MMTDTVLNIIINVHDTVKQDMIKPLHPYDAESKREYDRIDTGKEGIAVCLERMGKHCVYGADEHKLCDPEGANHSVFDGMGGRKADDETQPEFTREVKQKSDCAADTDTEE